MEVRGKGEDRNVCIEKLKKLRGTWVTFRVKHWKLEKKPQDSYQVVTPRKKISLSISDAETLILSIQSRLFGKLVWYWVYSFPNCLDAVSSCSSSQIGPFAILDPQDQVIDEFYEVRKRRETDSEAPKLWKSRSGPPLLFSRPGQITVKSWPDNLKSTLDNPIHARRI